MVVSFNIDLMKNRFGNYVVQKALKLSNGFLKVKLVNNIKKNIEKIRNQKIVDKWKSIIKNSTTCNLALNKMQNYNTGYISPHESNSPNSSSNSHNSYNSYNSLNSQGQFQHQFITPHLMMGPVQNRFSSKSGTSSPTYPINMPQVFIINSNFK